MPVLSSQTSALEGITVLTELGQWKVWRNGQLVDLPGEVLTANSFAPSQSNLGTDLGQPLHANPPGLKKQSAAFYFFTEDEEEILKLKLPNVGALQEYSLAKIVQKVLQHYSLSLTEVALGNLKNCLYGFLRGVRTKVSTWELLQASVTTGGVNLEMTLADTLIGLAEEIRQKIVKSGGTVMDDWQKTLTQQAEQPKPAVKTELKLPTLNDNKPEVSVTPKPAEIKTPVAPVAPIQPAAKPESFHKSLQWEDQKVGDVRRSYKLVSPIEELAMLNLDIFRKMGEPKIAAAKIQQKVKVLAEESIGKGAQAVQSWRKSPLQRMYVKIGQLSLEQNKSIDSVINSLVEQGEKIMSMSEFEVVSDLNQTLRL